MPLSQIILNKRYRQLDYPDGVSILFIDGSHPFLEIEIARGACRVVEEGIVTNATINAIKNDGWIFATDGMLVKSATSIHPGNMPTASTCKKKSSATQK